MKEVRWFECRLYRYQLYSNGRNYYSFVSTTVTPEQAIELIKEKFGVIAYRMKLKCNKKLIHTFNYSTK